MKDEIFSSDYLRSFAIMGGTFDPIHYGHLIAAETVRQEFSLDKVIFVPSGDPPHKSDSAVNDKEHRYLMAVAATLSNPHFDVSRIEIERTGFSYTVDTLSRICELCPGDMPVYFIIGADALLEIPTWKNPEKLFSMCRYVAVTRPGCNRDAIAKQLIFLRDKYEARINLIEIPSFDISSTEIRQRIQNGESVKYLLPDEVNIYIEKNGLYRNMTGASLDYGAVTAYLKENLSGRRYDHTMTVADLAVRLSKFYGVNEDKAYVAGLFHDVAKDISDKDKLSLCEEYGIEIDDFMREKPDLTHGFLGAEMAKSLFGICDKDILNAIRYHTTGRAKMSVLERVVLLADAMDETKYKKSEIDKVRRLAEKNLNKAVISVIIEKIQYTEKKKQRIHPLSFEALKFLEQDL